MVWHSIQKFRTGLITVSMKYVGTEVPPLSTPKNAQSGGPSVWKIGKQYFEITTALWYYNSLVARKSHLKGPTKELGKSAAKKKKKEGSEHCKLKRKYV